MFNGTVFASYGYESGCIETKECECIYAKTMTEIETSTLQCGLFENGDTGHQRFRGNGLEDVNMRWMCMTDMWLKALHKLQEGSKAMKLEF